MIHVKMRSKRIVSWILSVAMTAGLALGSSGMLVQAADVSGGNVAAEGVSSGDTVAPNIAEGRPTPGKNQIISGAPAKAVVLDGVADEGYVWDFEKYFPEHIVGEKDTGSYTIFFGSVCDEDNLYIAYQIVKDEGQDTNFDQYPAAKLFLSGASDPLEKTTDGHDIRFDVSNAGAVSGIKSNEASGYTEAALNIEAGSKIEDNTMTIEVKVPFSAIMKSDRQNGDVIGWDGFLRGFNWGYQQCICTSDWKENTLVESNAGFGTIMLWNEALDSEPEPEPEPELDENQLLSRPGTVAVDGKLDEWSTWDIIRNEQKNNGSWAWGSGGYKNEVKAASQCDEDNLYLAYEVQLVGELTEMGTDGNVLVYLSDKNNQDTKEAGGGNIRITLKPAMASTADSVQEAVTMVEAFREVDAENAARGLYDTVLNSGITGAITIEGAYMYVELAVPWAAIKEDRANDDILAMDMRLDGTTSGSSSQKAAWLNLFVAGANVSATNMNYGTIRLWNSALVKPDVVRPNLPAAIAEAERAKEGVIGTEETDPAKVDFGVKFTSVKELEDFNALIDAAKKIDIVTAPDEEQREAESNLKKATENFLSTIKTGSMGGDGLIANAKDVMVGVLASDTAQASVLKGLKYASVKATNALKQAIAHAETADAQEKEAALLALKKAQSDYENSIKTGLFTPQEARTASERLTFAPKGTIQLDGVLDEGIWQSAEGYTLEHNHTTSTVAEYSEFKTAWDDQYFYMGFEIKDKNPVEAETISSPADIYEKSDGVEIFLDGNNSKGMGNPNVGYDTYDDFHVYLTYTGKYIIQGGANGAWAETEELNPVVAATTTSDGYNIEIAFPLSELGVEDPGEGTVIGVTATRNNNVEGARLEYWWTNEEHVHSRPYTWGTCAFYETRKPVISREGSAVVKAGTDNWNKDLWNFNDEYSLKFKDIPGATVKVASLSDYEGLYLALLAEGIPEDKNPFVRMVLSGTANRGDKVDYDYEFQWDPRNTTDWRRMTINRKGAELPAVTKVSVYDLGDGKYASVVKIPWAALSNVIDPAVPRADHSIMSFSFATGNGGVDGAAGDLAEDGDNTRWTPFNYWSGNAFAGTASLMIHNPNIREMDVNKAPEVHPYFDYSIAQGTSITNQIKVTDPNEGDTVTLTYEALVDNYDEAVHGTFDISDDGTWTYTAPAGFLSPEGVNFMITATDSKGGSSKARIQIKVEPTPTNKTYYVNGDTGNDSNDGLSPEKAFKTITAAHDKTCPGDTVLIYGSKTPYGWLEDSAYDDYVDSGNKGTYGKIRDGVLVITRSGLPDAWITYKAAPGEKPVIQANSTWHNVKIAANYIVFEGITIRGDTSERMSYDEAYEAFWSKVAGQGDEGYNGSWDMPIGRYNTNGMDIGPITGREFSKDTSNSDPIVNAVQNPDYDAVHHVIVRNCVAENLGGGGIGGSNCDYVTFENCEALNNCWWGMYGNSGFGFIDTVDIDDNRDDFKLIIRNSISAGNRHFIPWKANTIRLSDGNGIILDTMDDRGYDYKGKVLVANNLVYENGGSGIHTFRADYSYFVNNTIFNNGVTPELGWSEMDANDSEYCRFYNNIVYNRGVNKLTVNTNKTNFYDYNIFYNSLNQFTGDTGAGANNIYNTDPMFANVSEYEYVPEGFDPKTGYPKDWYEVRVSTNAGSNPKEWSKVDNALKSGWYPGTNYDVTTRGFDFTLKEGSPAAGTASEEWLKIAGAADGTPLNMGIFGKVGADQEGTDITDYHSNTEIRNAKAATCTEDGYTGDEVCTVCGRIMKEGEVIPAFGHHYEDFVTEPTKDSQGYTTHTCSICGDTYTDTYVDALPDEPSGGDDNNEPNGNDDNNEGTEAEDNNEADVTAPADTVSPKTGDTHNIMLWALILVLGIAIVSGEVIAEKKKKK